MPLPFDRPVPGFCRCDPPNRAVIVTVGVKTVRTGRFRIHHDSGRAGLAVGVDLGCHQAAHCALEPQVCKGKKTAKKEEELTRPVE